MFGTNTVLGHQLNMANLDLRAEFNIDAFSRPEFGPFPDERFGLMPVGWSASPDWMA